MVNMMSTISSAFKGGASLTCCSPILHQPSRKELNVCKFLSSHCLEGWWIMKIYTHKFWLYWQRMTGKQYLWTAWWEHEQTQWWAARALLWPVERHRLWYTGMILPRGCPCWVILHVFVQDNGQTCNYWEMWAAEKMEFFSAQAALQKALSVSRCYWSAFEEGRFFLSIVWYEPAEKAVCVLGRIQAWWQLGISGFYDRGKPKGPKSMCTVSSSRAACAQAPLGTARNSVSHLPSVVRLPLVIETGSHSIETLSSHSEVFIFPYDPFLLPVTFITGIWLCRFPHKVECLDLGQVIKPKINTAKPITFSFTA